MHANGTACDEPYPYCLFESLFSELPKRFKRGEDFVSSFCSCLFQEKALGFGDTPMPLLRDCVENFVTDSIKENHFHAPIT